MKKLLSVFLVSLLSTFIFAENEQVKKLVNPNYYDQLVKNGTVELIHKEGNDKYVLLPQTDYSSKVLSNRVKKGGKDFPFVFEGLFLLNKKDLLATSNSTDTQIDITDVSRVFRSISKMQGMTYYSTTKKKELVLYKKAYTISGPDSETPIADDNKGNADGKVLYCLQDDASFGVTRYKLNYYQSDKLLYAVFTSTDPIGLGPFTGIEKGNIKINALVIDCGDDLLLYLSTDATCNSLPGIKKQVTDSMTSRMKAVYKWFIKQF